MTLCGREVLTQGASKKEDRIREGVEETTAGKDREKPQPGKVGRNRTGKGWKKAQRGRVGRNHSREGL